jgi:hypothetical protein
MTREPRVLDWRATSSPKLATASVPCLANRTEDQSGIRILWRDPRRRPSTWRTAHKVGISAEGQALERPVRAYKRALRQLPITTAVAASATPNTTAFTDDPLPIALQTWPHHRVERTRQSLP